MKLRLIQSLLLLLAILIGAAWLLRGSRIPETRRAPEPAAMPPAAPAGREPVKPATPEAPTPAPKVRTIPLRGKLVSGTGDAIPLAAVEVFALDAGRMLTRFSVETDENGGFQADCPEATQVTVTAHLPRRGRTFYRTTLPDADHLTGLQTGFTLAFRNPVEFDGVLLSPDGAPLAGARLRFHPMSTRYLDEYLGTVAHNLLCGMIPPDSAWDERCREALFLTDCEAASDAAGGFRAHSMIAGINYTVEVLRQGQERALLDLHTRGLKDKVRLQVPR